MNYAKILSCLILIISLPLIMNAQQKPNDYSAAWKKIDSLIEKKGLFQSAVAEINKIYTRAKAEKNEAQVIKALVYRSKLSPTFSEEGLENVPKDFEKEIASAQEPARSILNSITADSYLQYFQQHRWQLYDRSNTVNFKKEDIATWSADDFHKKISDLYEASVKNIGLLQKTSLESYNAIIEKGNARQLRPTLYDLLANRALDYFKRGEMLLNKPAYNFEISDPKYFDASGSFVNQNISSPDSTNPLLKAIRLYQQVLKFHLNDTKPDALIDADIDRIGFLNAHYDGPDKDSLYQRALLAIAGKYPNEPTAAQAWYLVAQFHVNQARLYNPLAGDAYRFEKLEAKRICESVLTQKDSSEGKSNCANLLAEINRAELRMETERVNVPGQPFRTLVSFQNLTSVNFRIVPMDKTTHDLLLEKGATDSFWLRLTKIPALKNFSRQFPDTKDLQLHAAEIAVEALPVGQYALIASPSSDFTLGNNPMAAQFFYVSNLAYIQKQNHYYVLNRQTGQPVVRASVQAWYRYYDASSRKNKERKGENVFSDKNGHFIIEGSKTGQRQDAFRIEVATTDDRLFLDEYQYPEYRYPTQSEQKSVNVAYYFTDRSIYRPGQTVYFKAIVIRREGNKTSIVPNLSSKLVLRDANGQAVSELAVTTNEYGSYSGKFVLPTGMLNGQFSIRDSASEGEASFSVEEYKRPKFSVSLEKPSGSYRVNDTITVKGNAKAFAGNNIDAAAVKYRVVRRTVYPLWFRGFDYDDYGRNIYPPRGGQDMEIINGNLKTDANGEFTISFKAIPDSKVERKSYPNFYYEITADVTDINGETRSGEVSVSVGYQALQLNLDIPQKLHADSISALKVRTTNSNGIFDKATFSLSITRLETPTRIFRSRYWKQPDQFLMTKEEYYKVFPFDVYKDEILPTAWPKAETTLQVTDTSSADGSIRAKYPKLKAGWYLVEANAKDKYGEEVKALQYVQVYTDTIINPNAFADVQTNKSLLEPNEKLRYSLRTNLDSLFVIHEIEKADDSSKTSHVSSGVLKKGVETMISEKDRGGFNLGFVFVKNNRVYTIDESVMVPYSNKELKITQESFRDKTLPGSGETWRVKITGSKKEKVASELVTAMYDASLDEYRLHGWASPAIYPYFYKRYTWNTRQSFTSNQATQRYIQLKTTFFRKAYDQLLSVGENGEKLTVRLRGAVPGMQVQAAPPMQENARMEKNETAIADWQQEKMLDSRVAIPLPPKGSMQDANGVNLRKNFNETAFFFPDLKKDSAGNISFSFTMPEALTKWKWMMLAHTKDLQFAYDEKTVITQKDLMVQPNPPRFLRQGDRMDFSAKIVNLTAKEITGQVQLQFFDAETNAPVDGWFNNVFPNQYFTASAGQSTPVAFSIEIPFQYNKPLLYRIIASAKDSSGGKLATLSDGEEAYLPVISNRMLVTETLPLNMGTKTEKQFRLEKLINSGSSETLQQHALTVEYSSNPVWYAIQALPYLNDYPYECAEQTFNRYYANALASKIANASPKIREVFEKWKSSDTAALLSNLQKNEELKSILLEETPWVMEGKSESEQKKQIALLFDMVKMNQQLASSLNKLVALQTSNGGFAWFQGGREDRYMTQYIVTGIGHLQKLGALPANNETIETLLNDAIDYLDQRIKDDYNNLLKSNKQVAPATDNLGSLQIQYLYMRSFFQKKPVPGDVFKAYNYYRKQSQQFWVKKGKYMQGMIALSLNRTGELVVAKSILESLKQTAVRSEEIGMYWKEVTSGVYWHQAPIETHSLLVEAFAEVSKDPKLITELRTWLLKQKQTRDWKTTKATAEACYALLLSPGGSDASEGLTKILSSNPEVTIQVGSKTIDTKASEAGTGYIKQTIDGQNVSPEMGAIKVSIKNAGSLGSWGAVYWQYFENLDKITPAASPLKVSKKIFVEKNSDRGPILQPVTEAEALKVGDKVKVRIEIRTDRDMEYVHLKDMRAASMEPVNVLSSYKWQGGLGYYESTKDASTNFFFDRLPKGTYVFEYPVFITHTGTFINGVSSIQCMYAPEFASQSEGGRIAVE